MNTSLLRGGPVSAPSIAFIDVPILSMLTQILGVETRVQLLSFGDSSRLVAWLSSRVPLIFWRINLTVHPWHPASGAIRSQTIFLNSHCRISSSRYFISHPKKRLRLAGPVLFSVSVPGIPSPLCIRLRPIQPLNCSSNITSSVWPFSDLSNRADRVQLHAPLASWTRCCRRWVGAPPSHGPSEAFDSGRRPGFIYFSIPSTILMMMYLVPTKCVLVKARWKTYSFFLMCSLGWKHGTDCNKESNSNFKISNKPNKGNLFWKPVVALFIAM